MENADSTIAIASDNDSKGEMLNRIFESDFILVPVFILFFVLFKFAVKMIWSNSGEKENLSREEDSYKKEYSSIENNQDKTRDAFVILKEIQESGSVPDISVFNKLLEMSTRLDQFETLHKLYEIISDEVASPITIDISTYRVLYKALAVECEVNKQKEMVSKIKLYDEDMKKRGLESDLAICNAKIELYVKLDIFNSAWEYFDSMGKNNLIPNPDSLSLLLEGIRNLKNKKPSSTIDQYISGIFTNIKTSINKKEREPLLFKLIEACLFLGKVDKAEEILQDLKKNPQNLPGIRLYTLLVNEYLNKSKLDKAFISFKEMRFRFARIDSRIYEKLSTLAFSQNKFEIVNDIYEKMKLDGVLINEVIYKHLLLGNNKHKNYLKVFEIFEIIQKEMINHSDIEILNAVIEAYLESGLYVKVFQLFELMKKKNEEVDTFPRPNIDTYILVIRSYILSGRVEDAKQLYMIMKERSKSNTAQFFNAVAGTFAQCNELDVAVSILHEMKQFGISRTTETYAIILKIHSDQLNEEKCILTLDDMLRENLRPNLAIYSCLLNLFIKKKKIYQAIGIFTDIKLNKFTPDQSIYNSIVIASATQGMFDKAMEFVLDSSSSGIYLPIETYKLLLDNLTSNKDVKVSEKLNYSEAITKILKELREKNAKLGV